MPQNNKTVIAKRRQEIAELYLKGKSQREIAEILTITQGQISKDLSSLRKEWRQNRLKDIDEKIATELAKIDNLERKYWEAWEKSVEDYKKKSQKLKGKSGQAKPDSQELSEAEVIQFGEPRYLQGVERCIDKRCKLLGLDAPAKMQVEDHSFVSFLMGNA